MASWLEVITTFVGTMLVLALVAQSLQDVVKFSFAIKAWTRLKAVRQLVREAARTAGLGGSDGDEIVEQVLERLRNLAQNGVRKGKLRLDALDKTQLMDLVQSVDAEKIDALKPLTKEVAAERLKDVAREIEKWFGLSLGAVDERYRRRMRLGALGGALLVVLAVNADAFSVLRFARNDPQFRMVVAEQASVLQTADGSVRAFADSLARARADTTQPADTTQAPDTTQIADTTRLAGLLAAAEARRDTLARAVVAGEAFPMLGYPDGWRPTVQWVLGILIAALLVSLGAPFWHDILEMVFGWKGMARAAGVRPPAAPGK